MMESQVRAAVQSPAVSIILPSYNEAGNIVPLIRALKLQLRVPHEILVMDDRSPDETARIAREAFADDPSVRVITRTGEQGLAKAIRDGIARSVAAKILVMDSDFNHDPQFVGRLVERSAGADMVIGSRFQPGGGGTNRWRYACSLVYSCAFMRPLLRTKVWDNLSGYYIISRDALMALPVDEMFYGFGDYFFRLVCHARASGCTIVEMPIFYRDRLFGRSRVNLVTMLIGYTWEVIKLRWDVSMRTRRARAATQRPESRT